MVLALGSAALLVAAFPPFGLAGLAFVAPAPLLVALRGRGPGAAFLLGLLFGAAFLMGAGHWVTRVPGVGWLAFLCLAAYLGAYYGLFGAAYAAVTRAGVPAVIAAPVLWVSAEFLRGNAGPLAHPWAFVAHTQYQNLPLIQVASLTGAYGVSFLVVLVGAAVAQAVLDRRLGPGFLVALAALLAVAALGLVGLSRGTPGKGIPVTVIQGDIPQDLKWDPERVADHLAVHVALTRRAAAAGPSSLVVWPESSVQNDLQSVAPLRRQVFDLAREIGRPLLVGADRRPLPQFAPAAKAGSRGVSSGYRPSFPDAAYNAAVMIRPGSILGPVYDKQHLLPFGEFQPWPSLAWPAALRRKAPDYTPGGPAARFPVASADGTAWVGVLICWESMFPGLARDRVRNGADFLVNMTNEAWFGPAAAEQFLAAGVFRAVENRVALVRAANTGVSGFVGPRGRILGRVAAGGRDTYVAGYLTHVVPLGSGGTLYTGWGDWFAVLCVGLSALLVAGAGFRRVRAWRT